MGSQRVRHDWMTSLSHISPLTEISSEASLCYIIFWTLIYCVITIKIMSNSQEPEGLCCKLLILGFVIFLLVLLRKFRLVPPKSSTKVSYYCNWQFKVYFFLPCSMLFPICLFFFFFFFNLGAPKKPCTAISIQFILWTPVWVLFKWINKHYYVNLNYIDFKVFACFHW